MNKEKKGIAQMTQLAVLIAILAILTLTNLGFITTAVASVTLLHIPVIIGSITMGPYYGGILGLSFGIIAMLNATFRGATPVDMMFTPFGGHGMPIQAIITCIIPRIILGILPYVFYRLFAKVIKKEYLSTAISAGLSTILHTVMVLGCLYFLFFTDMTFSDVIKNIFLAVVGLNGLLEMLAAVIICSAVSVPLIKYLRSRA